MVKQDNIFIIILVILFMGVPMNAKEYESPVYTQYVAEIIRTFSKQMNKEFGLICTASGGGMPHDVEEIHVQFEANQSATIEEARELEVKVTERFVQIINAHEKIRPFLREYPFPSNRADVAIAFCDSRKQSRDDDVYFVFQARNRIWYQAKNTDNSPVLKDIKDESYEDALKIVQSSPSKIVSTNQKNSGIFLEGRSRINGIGLLAGLK